MIKSNSGIRKADIINRRMFIIGAAKVIVFAGIVARLFSLQINENKNILLSLTKIELENGNYLQLEVI